MDSGLYAAYTGLLARTQALDTAANNLANAGTAGFRAEKDFFRGVMVDNLSGITSDSQVGSTVNDYGILGGNMLDYTQGQIATTGNPLDLALEGDGFFAVQTGQTVQAGINGQPDQTVPVIKYTRQGNFSRSSTGVLQDSEDHSVLDAQQRPIIIPTRDIQVSSNGTLSGVSPAGSSVVGQVGLFPLPDKRVLTADGTTRLSAPDAAKPI